MFDRQQPNEPNGRRLRQAAKSIKANSQIPTCYNQTNPRRQPDSHERDSSRKSELLAEHPQNQTLTSLGHASWDCRPIVSRSRVNRSDCAERSQLAAESVSRKVNECVQLHVPAWRKEAGMNVSLNTDLEDFVQREVQILNGRIHSLALRACIRDGRVLEIQARSASE